MRNGKKFAALRIRFGIIWAIDAFLKWQPAFASSFAEYFSDALQSQPAPVATWINLWIGVVSAHPEGWAILIAIAETAIAIGLIFGFFTRTARIGGSILVVLIWSVTKGFGVVFAPGTTDVGAGIIIPVRLYRTVDQPKLAGVVYRLEVEYVIARINKTASLRRGSFLRLESGRLEGQMN